MGLLGENLGETRNEMTLYTSGPEDWYRELATEEFATSTTGVDEETPRVGSRGG